jgi:hypothetical protein
VAIVARTGIFFHPVLATELSPAHKLRGEPEVIVIVGQANPGVEHECWDHEAPRFVETPHVQKFTVMSVFVPPDELSKLTADVSTLPGGPHAWTLVIEVNPLEEEPICSVGLSEPAEQAAATPTKAVMHHLAKVARASLPIGASSGAIGPWQVD